MCGIVGYVGNKDSAPILVSGLKKLEYRGYDSAGVAVVDRNTLNVVRAMGKLHNLESRLFADWRIVIAPMGARGFWVAAAASLAVAGVLVTLYFLRVSRVPAKS